MNNPLYQIRPAPQETPSSGETLGAAFRLENDIVNWLSYSKRSRHAVDTGFDLSSVAATSPLWAEHGERLSVAQSREEFQSIEARLQQETRDREILSSAGMGGFAAGVLAGSLSPVMFIPLTGQGRGAKGVLEAFALAGAAATTQEAALLLNQELRTATESGIGIAAGTVLGGLLGSAAVYLRPRDRARLAEGMRYDAPPAQAGMVIREADGSYTRTGGNMELEFPAGTVRSPADVAQIQSINNAFGAVDRAAREGDYPALRALVDNPATSIEARGLAQDVLARSTSGARAAQAARAADVPDEIAEAWGAYVQRSQEAAQPQAALTQDQVRQELMEAFEVAGVPLEQRPGLFAKLEADAQPGSVRGAQELAAEIRNERIAPHVLSEADVASAGAKRTAEQFTPMLPQLDPETGAMTQVPLIDPATRPDPGTLARDAGGSLTQLGRVSPVIRTVQQSGMPVKAQGARRAMLQMSDGGVEFEGAQVGVPPAPGGTVEHRLGFYYARMAAAFQVQQQAYMRYLGRENTFLNRRLTDFQSTFSIKPGAGQLNFKEFKEQVVDSFHNGYDSPIKEANDVAREWSKSFFGAFNEAMLEASEGRGARALYEVLDDADPMKNYFTHIFSVDKVTQDREGFVTLVADYYQSSAAAIAGRRWQKLQQREAADATYEDLLKLSAEDARLELDAIEEALSGAKQMHEFSPQVQRIRDLRDERRVLRDEEYEKLLADETARRTTEIDPDTERALKLKASSAVKEQYDDLTAQINALEAKLPADVQGDLDRQKMLRSRRAMIQKSFGAIEARQSAAMRQIEKNEEVSLNAIESFERKAVSLHGKLGRISDADLDAELVRLERQFDKSMTTLEKSDARLEKLGKDIGTEFEPTEKLSIAQAQKEMREARANSALERYSKAASYDREGAREAIEERLRLARQYLSRVNGARSERNARLRDRIKEQDPQRAIAQGEGIAAARAAREENFINWLQESGAEDFDLSKGEFDFSAAARDLASELSYKITGNPLRIGQLDLLPELKGPMKRRVLDIPYDQKKAFLELDSERVLSRYTRSMGADIELYRAFGSVSGNTMLMNASKELKDIESLIRTRKVDEAGKEITEARRAKEIKAHESGARLILKDLEHTVTRLRGMAGLPSDPSSFWYRAGRAAMLANVPLMMGSAAITSIPDLGRPVMVHGMHRTFKDGWMPLIGGLVSDGQRKLNQAQLRQLELMNIGVEMFTQQRAQSSFDISMDTAGRNKFERGLEFISQKTPVIAGFGPWTDWNKSLAGMITMSRMLDGIDRLAAGRMKPNDPEIAYLTATSLTPNLMQRISGQFNSPEGHSLVNGTKVPNLEGWKDYEALRAFSAAMHRESDRIVITPGLERARVADEHILGRLFMQFRSFTMGAHSKMLISGLQQRDTAAFHMLSGVTFSLALGALSYYIWARTTGERATEEMMNAGWETWMDQAIYRSGVLGLFAEVQSVGSKIPATADFVTFAGGDLAGRRPDSVMAAIAGPSFGTAQTIASVLAGMDSPTQGTLSQARKLIPYQNVFYLRRAIDMVEEGLGETLDLPERRQ